MTGLVFVEVKRVNLLSKGRAL